MVNRYSYEFKKFASGKRKGEVYCNIKSVKTGKTIKTVSSKKSLQAVKKAIAQQKTRKADEIAWKRVEKEVTKKGGTKKQYQKAVKRVRAANRKDRKKDPKKRKLGTLGAAQKAAKQTGHTTRIRAFYQMGTTKDAQPYIIGESSSEQDEHIEYSSWQDTMAGDNLVYNIDSLRQDFKRTLSETQEAGLEVFYGGYEITVTDNETGKVIRKESEGGYYPTNAGKKPKGVKTQRKRTKKSVSRF